MEKKEKTIQNVQKKRILIAEDNPINRAILVNMLSQNYEVLESRDGQEALDRLGQYGTGISAVLLDLDMPLMNGFQFLQKMYRTEEYLNIPVIVATGSAGERTEAEALLMGAWDFVTKPYDRNIIQIRLRNAIEHSQLSAFQQLKYLAEFDSLTNIYNKTKFFEKTHAMLMEHSEKSFVFVRIDIDRFQLINSFYGTKEGDGLLRYVAECLRSGKKETVCTYGRIEADVFGLCFSYSSQKTVIDGIKVANDQIKAYNRSFDIVPVFGVYYLQDHAMKVEDILGYAALAAESCKGNYVNTAAVYQPEMGRILQWEQEIIGEMGNALKLGQFCIYLQPKYDLSNGMPCGAEALVRWNHPDKGMISPGDFIPVFEKNGFIAKLDFFVWETTCTFLAKWISEGYDPYPVSVNVSRVNLYNPKFVEQIVELIQKYKIPPALLQLELTESAYMDNPLMMKTVVRRLHEEGFTILMDDFGNGYSSLSILKDIEVDILKIDMQFLGKSEISGRGENIVASVVRMANWLNIPSIAEGAERVEQVNFLQSVGCEYVQGYYFAAPMPVSQYEKLAKERLVVKSSPRASGLSLDKLWSSEPEIELLFSNSSQAGCIYEFDGEKVEILRMNQAFLNTYGYSDKYLSSNQLDYVFPECKGEVRDTFQRCIQQQKTVQCEYRRKFADGREAWVDLKLQYADQVGRKYILLGTLNDITTQKQVEQELRMLKKKIAT